jgi:hypothetical protein
MNSPVSRGAHNASIAIVMSVTSLINLTALALVAGCGANLDVDNAALYTPESLAAEFAFSYKTLGSDTKATASKIKARTNKDRGKLPLSENALKKGKRGGVPRKSEPKGPLTLEELVQDVDAKIDLIRDFSRSESCGKMTEAISKDQTLDDNERKTLTELVAKLAG